MGAWFLHGVFKKRFLADNGRVRPLAVLVSGLLVEKKNGHGTKTKALRRVLEYKVLY